MKESIYIKNMVCNRCIASVLSIFNAENYIVESVELGKVVATKKQNSKVESLRNALAKVGFEITCEATLL